MKYIIPKTIIISIALTLGNAALAQCSCCPPPTVAETHDHHAAMSDHKHGGDALTQQEFKELLPLYLQLQEALAGDNLEEAKSVGEKLSKTAAGISDKSGMQMAKAGESIAGASDMGTARKAFLAISNRMIAAAKSAEDSDLYLAYCPMAFNNTGGAWLQDESMLANPYFGSMMLRCGTIKPISK